MFSWYRADLHIHTVLSACAELTMGPRDIVLAAEEKQLDIIAITDHNSVANTRAVIQAGVGHDLLVIPGMEVATAEDVHVICLFPDWQKAQSFQDFIYQHLLDGYYDESLYGPQIVCDEEENIIDREHKLLAFSTTVPMTQVYDQVVKHEGIAYPAHVDRQAYSALHTLGHIPKEIPFDAVEISHRLLLNEATIRFPELARFQIVTASDAHDIKDIGKAITFFFLEKPTFAEIKMAFAHEEGRLLSVMRPEVMVQNFEF
jgi:3',5'-nucleoside bisphosphate phosphatase